MDNIIRNLFLISGLT